MAKLSAPKGTKDILPQESYQWQYVESVLKQIALDFNFKELRTPTFESTEVFARGVGDTTDVVTKEMYTFLDKGGRSVTLRPEGTAGIARSFVEHGLYAGVLPLKLYYLISCFRYEKPQAGRLREFHQFGVECFGTPAPAADAEVISLAYEIFGFLGVEDIHLEINSIGCPECRKNYHAALKSYFESKKGDLCPTCLERLDKNPMRILDCKSPICSEIAAEAPVVIDYLCEDCADHFKKVQAYLDEMLIPYSINPQIVRGLDYYTRTVFEFVSDSIGAQGTVCGGGRYDGLIEELGGSHTPSLGFGMGIERLMLLLEAQGIKLPEPKRCDLYIAPIGDNASLKAARLVQELRQSGVSAQFDVVGRSVKAQMKFANKLGAKFTVVLGDDDIAANKVNVKNMDSGEVTEMALDEFSEEFMELTLQQSALDLESAVANGENIDLKSFLGGLM